MRVELRSISFKRWHEEAAARPGFWGAVLAALTVLAAALVATLLLFGRILLLSALVTWLWPRIFSPDLTRWVFGAEGVSFWKVLLLFIVAELVVRALRRRRAA